MSATQAVTENFFKRFRTRRLHFTALESVAVRK